MSDYITGVVVIKIYRVFQNDVTIAHRDNGIGLKWAIAVHRRVGQTSL
jgi:hypothetical protein